MACQHTKKRDPVKNRKRFWIKERRDPRLGIYYVACGKAIRYGDDVMYGFDNQADYSAALKELEANGETIQWWP